MSVYFSILHYISVYFSIFLVYFSACQYTFSLFSLFQYMFQYYFHYSEGWLSVISKWLISYPQLSKGLSSIAAATMDFVRTCVFLLMQPLRYVTMVTLLDDWNPIAL